MTYNHEETKVLCPAAAKEVERLRALVAFAGRLPESEWRMALRIIENEQRVSASAIQRLLVIGYNRAVWILDVLEMLGYVTEPDPETGKRGYRI